MKETAYIEWQTHNIWNYKYHNKEEYKKIFLDYTDYFFKRLEEKRNFTNFRFCDGEYRCLFDFKTHGNELSKFEVMQYNKLLHELMQFKVNAEVPPDDLIIHMQRNTPYCIRDENRIQQLNPEKLSEVADSQCPSLDGVCPSGFFGFISVVDDLMERFIQLLNSSDYYIILVGPDYLSKLPGLRIDAHANSVLEGSWRFQQELENNVRVHVEYALKILKKTPLIIYAASIGGKMTIINMYRDYKNKLTQLDCGSIFDPLVNVISRPWHAQLVEYYKSNGIIDKFEKTITYSPAGVIVKESSVKNLIKNKGLDTQLKHFPPAKNLEGSAQELALHVSVLGMNNIPNSMLEIDPNTIAFKKPFDSNIDFVLQNLIVGNEENILEIGNWVGFITNRLHHFSKNANIFTINKWKSSIDSYSSRHHPVKKNEKNALDNIIKSSWNNFVANIWAIQDKVFVYDQEIFDAFMYMPFRNVRFDVIYIHSTNFETYEDYLKCLTIVLTYFPYTKILGDGFNDEFEKLYVQRALKQIQIKFNVKIKNKKDIWYIS